MFGVSPAYIISRFGDGFTSHDVIAELPDLKNLGYDSLQLEVYHAASIGEWVDTGFRDVISTASELGVTVSQCVGHVLLNAFVDEKMLDSKWGIREAMLIADALSGLSCSVLTVPVPPFATGTDSPVADSRRTCWNRIASRFIEKLGIIVEVIAARSLQVALEVLPGSLVGGIGGFLDLACRIEEATGTKVGFNLDTGHAYASGELLPLAIHRLGSRITGTHLCDNRGRENLSLAPGKGDIRWNDVLDALHVTGYRGSCDIEINCPADRVHEEYAGALRFLKNIAAQTYTQEAV